MSQGELIAGIAQDAAAEAQRLLEEASKAAQERREATENQASAILEEARRKAGEQARNLSRQIASTAKMEVKRIGLRVREQATRMVIERVRSRLAQMIGSPEYREALIGWLVEAIIGLSLPEAAVNACPAELELIDEGLLAEVQGRVLELTGRKVRLFKSDADPLVGQGVVLVGREGRLAFNNQVSTRLLRRQTQIRKIIYERLWKKES
jgi:vacuolar-type H+-ATPase subunit E/Vma4